MSHETAVSRGTHCPFHPITDYIWSASEVRVTWENPKLPKFLRKLGPLLEPHALPRM